MLNLIEIVSVAVEQLRECVAMLAEDGDAIVTALDQLLSRAGR